MEIGDVSPEGVAVPELGVAPLFDIDTELEDKLRTPEVSPLFHDSSLQGVRLPEVCPAPRDIVDVELEKALLSVSILPVRLGYLLFLPHMGCRTCHRRAPLICIKTRWSRGPLHRCWTVCRGASIVWRPMMMMLTVLT